MSDPARRAGCCRVSDQLARVRASRPASAPSCAASGCRRCLGSEALLPGTRLPNTRRRGRVGVGAPGKRRVDRYGSPRVRDDLMRTPEGINKPPAVTRRHGPQRGLRRRRSHTSAPSPPKSGAHTAAVAESGRREPPSPARGGRRSALRRPVYRLFIACLSPSRCTVAMHRRDAAVQVHLTLDKVGPPHA